MFLPMIAKRKSARDRAWPRAPHVSALPWIELRAGSSFKKRLGRKSNQPDRAPRPLPALTAHRRHRSR